MKRVIGKVWMLLLPGLLSGCSFDLFHDTSWLTACDIDPSTPGCTTDAADAGQDGEGGSGAEDAKVSDDAAADVDADQPG